MKYPYVIIDNDTTSVQKIQSSLQEYSDYICLGIAGNETDGIDLILERGPKLVFIEVEVDGQFGGACQYSIMAQLSKLMAQLPEFIVITKTLQYAVEGIRNKVLDYLLKPFDANELRRAVLRFQNTDVGASEQTICFKSYGDYRFVELDQVLYLKADNNTTDFILCNNQTVQAFKTLKHFQGVLPEHFVRIHNSYIVNSKYISRIHFGKSKCSIKNIPSPIPFSRTYKTKVEELKDLLYHNSMLQL